MGSGLIVDSTGADLRSSLGQISYALSLPPELLLACGIAESSLNPQAQRWGAAAFNTRALRAIDNQDWAALQDVIDQAWPDISFGIAQRIVKYSWAGTGEATWQNCLNVRQVVFASRDRDLLEMGRYLQNHYAHTLTADLTPTGGDRLLLALVAYNAGHIPLPNDPYWLTRKTTILRYTKALEDARARYAKEDAPVTEATNENAPLYIEGFIEQHPECAIWTADGSAGEPIQVTDRLRIAGAAEYVLIEIDGYVSPVPIDMSFFAPPPPV